MHRSIPWFALAAAIVVVDQLAKWWALAALPLQVPVEVLPFFNLTLVYNRGAAFSFLADAGGWQRVFFIVLALAIAAAIAVWLARSAWRQRWLAAPLALILGGAVGNLLDRVMSGAVTDFLDFYRGSYHWHNFNVADAAISVGIGLLLLDSLILSRHRRPLAEEE